MIIEDKKSFQQDTIVFCREESYCEISNSLTSRSRLPFTCHVRTAADFIEGKLQGSIRGKKQLTLLFDGSGNRIVAEFSEGGAVDSITIVIRQFSGEVISRRGCRSCATYRAFPTE